jgi:hypothetical protein
MFYDDFSTIDNTRLPSQMTKPRNWKELCTSSANSIINEEQCIDNLWPTFDPKVMFEDYYKGIVDLPTNENSERRVTFMDPIATIAAAERAARKKPLSCQKEPTPSFLKEPQAYHLPCHQRSSNQFTLGAPLASSPNQSVD